MEEVVDRLHDGRARLGQNLATCRSAEDCCEERREERQHEGRKDRVASDSGSHNSPLSLEGWIDAMIRVRRDEDVAANVDAGTRAFLEGDDRQAV